MNAATGLPIHGGDIETIARERGVEPGALLDFSANVNPLGPPAALLRALRDAAHDASHLERYPEPTYRKLREALAAQHVLDPEAIVVGNGAAALLEAAIAALGVRRALVPTPAFSEYRRALSSRNADFVATPLDRARDFALDGVHIAERARALEADCAVVNTPHNPSGSALSREALQTLVATLASEGRKTIVDEAFVDYIEDESIDGVAAVTPSLVAVRSLTKFFAVPALRVGFAVAHPDVARCMRATLPSWSVSSIAARALEAALGDHTFAERSRNENACARAELAKNLAANGFRALPSAANFLLLELPVHVDAPGLARRSVGEFGIVLRDATSYDGLEDGRFVRVAVRSAADNARLVAALAHLAAR